MKTSAFLIRVAICFLLSLIPVTELENRIYSGRMDLRGPQTQASQAVLIEVPASEFRADRTLQDVKNRLKPQQPAQIFVLTAERENEIHADSDGVVRRTRQLHYINFLGAPGILNHCLLRNLQACGSLKAKTLFLTEETDSPTFYRTPLGDMSEAELLANITQSEGQRHPVYWASFLIRALITLAMIVISAFYIIYYPVLISAIAVTGTGFAIVVVLFQLVFQLFDIYIPSANVAGSLLITYLVFTGYRLAFQENLQWRSLKQAQYLRELDQMKTNFVSLVSHDLKTPLAKIQAISERMRRELSQNPTDRAGIWKEWIESIDNSNTELKNYITSILNLSKIESQKIALNKKSNDVNQLIQQSLARLKPLAEQRGIKIEESLEPLFSVECDADLVRQVISNLADNAIKYSPANSRVIVRSSEEDGFIRVDVEDFGPGIPKDQLPLMFRKFSRFMKPLKEQVKGTGLGLYLSKYFIELHGGTIRLKSVEGQGTTFTFTLPLNGGESEAILG